MSVGPRPRDYLKHIMLGSFGVCSLAILLHSQQVAPASNEMDIYIRARTVVDMTRGELLQAYPDELRDLELTEDQQELISLLKEVGENVEAFFRDLPNTISKEQIRRERLSSDGTVAESVTQNYNYTAHMAKSGDWEEGRTDSRGHDIPHESMSSLSFLTVGFASSSLFLHPKHQSGCRFRYLGRQVAEPYGHVIAYAQKPGRADIVGRFSSEFRAAPISLLYQGFVWVDPRSFQIVRLRSGLLAPRNDAFLAAANSDIWYSEVQFKDISRPFWVPREVVVTLQYAGQKYRNRHYYSDYQVFMIAVEEKIIPPVVKK